MTKSQTAGRGRGGNRWLSSHGSLTFSLVYPDNDGFAQTDRGLLSLATAAGLGWCLDKILAKENTSNSVAIKWPNDLYLEDCKLGGILIETVAKSNKRNTIIGCGLNANNELQVSNSGSFQSTSLKKALGKSVDLTDLLTECVLSVDHAKTQLRDAPTEILNYCRNADWLKGKRVVTVDQVPGTAAGLDEKGRLIVERFGKMVSVSSGSVQVIS